MIVVGEWHGDALRRPPWTVEAIALRHPQVNTARPGRIELK